MSPRLIPEKLKAAVKSAAGRAAGTRELERRLEELERSIIELQPETLPISSALNSALSDYLRENDLIGLNVTVSKNDMMLRYIQKQKTSRIDAFLWYLDSGLQMHRTVEAIAARKAGSLGAAGTVLDFASGYGRLTRFLARAMSSRNVWASDVKADAVRFVQDQFGVNGFVSSEMPAPFPVVQKFDLIFVASLFSHLPDATFRAWLQRLVDSLAQNGTIAFSVHDVALTGEPPVPLAQQTPLHEFSRISEEVSLKSDNAPLSVDTYGTSVVNEAYVARIVNSLEIENHEYWRYPHAVHGIQDLYIISRDEAADFSGLAIPKLATSLTRAP